MFIYHERRQECRNRGAYKTQDIYQTNSTISYTVFISNFINLKLIKPSNKKSHIGRGKKNVIQIYIMPREIP